MGKLMVLQGRELSGEDVELIRGLMAGHRDWSRRRVSQELCRRWDWRNAQGQIKDMAARTLLLKLERGGHIRLPPRRQFSPNSRRNLHLAAVAHATAPIRGALRELRPLALSVVRPGTEELRLFNCLLARYHYLGHRNTVGENLRYLLRDCHGRPLACALFASAAWKCVARDQWIGWERRARERHLGLLTNNTRFLILPWVEVPHLASHVLALLVRRVAADWRAKYGHPVLLLESFVDRCRFRGTCYRAANWQCVGQTTGRTRNDRHRTIQAAVKDVYVYALSRQFRSQLCHVEP
jgi:hypothetical protein